MARTQSRRDSTRRARTSRRVTKAKPISHSQVQMTELVLPNDANTLGNVLGGRVMHWIDMACAMSAQRHARRSVVTASMDRIHFLHPIQVGQQVIISASVNASWGSSMEVGARVESEDPHTGKRIHNVSAYTTFVALDEDHHPTAVPGLIPETAVHKKRWEEAQQRRRLRLEERSSWMRSRGKARSKR